MATVDLTDRSVTVQDARWLHTQLVESLQSSASVIIDTRNIGHMDIIAMQLIEAARRHAGAHNIDIALSEPANASMRAIMDRAGLLESFTLSDTSFWLHED